VLLGAVQLTATLPLELGVALTAVGAPGAVAATTPLLSAVVPHPTLFSALTTN
jgi:hypothetical protein